ncbi:carbohydrate ABC transporter membrane protein 2, CUT1 family [Marinitoga hydrogenitolerans DSM 16785]|uniref:Carbohydrate ABC transporter membrane protein 2, CUT1 family n=1 Tax=Marinitoga hydrogenitolerans (strain DSM 16785 / JCM 12826 / AT1271) TaxID=1122195 RepID=A0A1M4VN25_MARH1|nr:ABC transporter permease subunit [Marinitoga hydrogenitolerans]SHE70210.1 carbohydrate ABC transporter membrane protein 2, CUT1 family [Marinitoga hydrogenitolerans DSM 16785]
MSWSKFTNTMGTLIIYLLVIGGAIVMAMPFAWMVVTSFKTGSEIAQWPPKWTSKNFKSEIMVNIKNAPSTSLGDQGSVSLAEFRASQSDALYNPYKKVLRVEDDPVKRGLVTLTFSTLKYGDNNDLHNLINAIKEYNAKYPVIQELSNKINSLEENPENFENFYFSLYSTSNGLFKKAQILKSLDKELKNSINYIDKFIKLSIDRLPYLKIKDSDNSVIKNEKIGKKEELKNYLINLKKDLENISSLIQVYSRGTGIISNDEINAIIEKMNSVNFKSFTDMYLRKVNRLLEKNIYNSIIYNKNTLNFKVFFENKFRDNQEYSSEKNMIKFSVPTKKIMKDSFIKNLSLSDIPDKFKKAIDENVDVFKIKDNFVLNLEHDFNNLVLEKLKINSEDLSRTLMIIRSLSKINIVNLDNVDKYLNIFDAEFIKEKNIDKSILLELSSLRKTYNNILEKFNKLYSDSISIVKIIDAPDFIDKIYYRNYSNIEIHFKNVYALWFLDDQPTMKAKFSTSEIFANVFENYVEAWNAAPFSKYYINTVFMATSTTILEIIIAAMAAFAFAKLEFWGKNILFTLFLATMMVPGEVMLVPNFITISKFRWLDTYYALIIPWIVSVFAIFLLRQQFLTIPNDLWDAAKIDGSSSWRFLWTVMVPLSKPALITGALLKFVGSWNAFLWVLIVTKSPEMRTLAVGLQTFTTESGTLYNLLMAASTFSIIPIIILFIFMQKYFVAGIARSGLKG